MARRFRKRPDLHLVAVPGIGYLKPNQIIEGAEYARFVPHILEEILDEVAMVTPAPSAEYEEKVAQHLKDVARANEELRKHEATPVVGAAELVAVPDAPVADPVPTESEAETDDEESDEPIPASVSTEKPVEQPAPKKRGRPPKKKEGEP